MFVFLNRKMREIVVLRNLRVKMIDNQRREESSLVVSFSNFEGMEILKNHMKKLFSLLIY